MPIATFPEKITAKVLKPVVEAIKESVPASKPAYQVLEEPFGHGRKIKVICVGAGASGLNLQHELDAKFGINSANVELVVYDKNPSIGGTWFENRYPGCACDIPSINYQYTWAPSSEWSSYYSGAPEILEYFKKTAADNKLDRNVKLHHLLVGAAWGEDDNLWHFKFQLPSGEIVEDSANLFVNATGVLNKWVWPKISGRESFKGQMLHSANWDKTVSLKGKRVAVIGSGSSAVQIIPNILDDVSSLTTFIRSKTWITAGFAQRFAGKNGANFKYNDTQREILRTQPQTYLQYRKNIESELNSRFRFILNGSAEQAEAKAFAEIEMRKKLEARPWVADVIVPTDFAVGCRRPTPGNGYLEALCDDRVTVVPAGIASIDETGIVDATGTHHEVDVIICATGFDVSWRPRYPLTGRNGLDLRDAWANGPDNYLSVTVPQFPNFYTIMGPYAPYGHGSVLPMTEHFARHFAQMVEKMVIERVVAFEPKLSAVADWREHRRTFLPRTAWANNCNSWFKQNVADGDVMMWPGSRLHFFEVMNQVKWEDYEITHAETNRFSYLANGFCAREFDGRDMSWYIGLLDGGKDAQPEYSDEAIKEFLNGGEPVEA